MFSRFPRIPRPFQAVFVVVAGMLVVGLARGSGPAGSDHASHGTAPAGADHSGHEMSEEEMQRAVDAWFATNPVRGVKEVSGAPVVTFRAFSNRFDADGNVNGTPIDTVVIGVGETVQWQRLIGAHTATSGVTATDADAGLMFDAPLDAANPIFQFTYEADGEYPFFCRTHDDFNMVGVVVVIGAVPTEKTTWGGLKARSR